MPHPIRWFSIACLTGFVQLTTAQADEPLHLQIDQIIAAKAEGRPTSPLADDAEFLRRVYLDLIGRIPSSQEAREFFNESALD